MADERDSGGLDGPELEDEGTVLSTAWLPRWLRKRVKESDASVQYIAERCGVTPTSLRQIRLESNARIAPPTLLWRIVAVLRGEDELSGMSDDQIMGALYRLLVVLGPEKLVSLATKSGNEIERIVSLGESAASGRLGKRHAPPKDFPPH